MATSPKHTILTAFLGLLFGLAISPWTNTKPQHAFVSPISNSLAQEAATPLPKPSSKRQSTMQQYFALFDKEQEMWNTPSQVLGETDQSELISPKKGRATIAVVGDSMVDTMGTGLPYLEKALKQYYPNMEFTLLNYGIGAENVTKVATRISTAYSYKDRQYPKVIDSGANIVIVESFAYNPIGDSDTDLDTYRHSLSQVINKAKPPNSHLLFLATIAPLKTSFGKGPGGVNWEQDTAYVHATKIQNYLEAGISTASQQGLPIIDCYHPTLLSSGEGKKELVSAHDGIHPSEAGHRYVSNAIARKIASLKLL